MPNHLMSKLHFSGEQKKINELLESIKGEETLFDFNKVLPMPESLNIEAGSRTDNGLKAYKDFITAYTMDGTEKKDLLNIPKEKEEIFLRMRPDIKRDEWNLGKAAFQNEQKYGTSSWHDSEINEYILDDINYDEEAVERGLAAYLRSENLDKKVYSIIPKVEARDGDLYGVFVIKSYGELDKTELIDITQELIGQAADGWGEGFEQHSITLGDDEVYISFWNSDDDYFLKIESEAFPEQNLEQTMGGM